MNIQHSSRTDEWNTPIHVLDLVHTVIGRPDFDPASSLFANARVGAKYFYTEEIDALKTDWPQAGTIYLNPPGGKIKNQSKVVLFWIKLMEYKQHPWFEEAIFCAFSAEALQTTQGRNCPSALDFPICIPAKRIAFDNMLGQRGSAPSHSNAIIYIPGNKNNTNKFLETFKQLGACR